MHTCYFSKKCRFSQAFLEELSKQPFAKEVRFLCVDPSPTRGPLPAWLKIIPTMLLAGSDAPLVGATAVNNWLFERKLVGGASGGAKPQQNRNDSASVPTYSADNIPRPTPSSGSGKVPNGIPVSGPLKQGEDGGPAAWHSAEMAGGNWSDKYSFVGDPFTAQNGVNPIVRNFELLGGAPGIPGGGGSSGGAPAVQKQQLSEKGVRLISDLEAFTAARDKEFTSHRRIG